MGKKRGGAVVVKKMGPKGVNKNPMDMMPTMEDFAIKPEDQIHLPPTPDRNYSIVWPISETFSLKTDEGGFQIIYPSYLDANKTVKLGRRICQEKAVPKPTVSDLSLVLQALQVRHVLQPYKGYSRDPTTLWDNPGRVVVDMSQYGSKSELLLEMAGRIPDLPDRQRRLAAEEAAMEQARQRQEEEAQKQREAAQKAAAASSSAAAGGGGSTTKKKGKKGRKK